MTQYTSGGAATAPATSTTEAGKQAGSQVAHTAADKAKDVAQETTRQARDLVGEAREQLRSQAGTQQASVVSNLRRLGDELNGMSSSSEQPGLATELAGQAKDRVNSVADWLDSREPGDLVDEVRRFARRRPGAFLLGAVVAGIAAGRLTRGVAAAHSDSGGQSGAEAYSADSQPTVQLPAAGGTQLSGVSDPLGQPAYVTPASEGLIR